MSAADNIILGALRDGRPYSHQDLAAYGFNVNETVNSLREQGYVIHEWRDRPLHWRQLGTVRYRLDAGSAGERQAAASMTAPDPPREGAVAAAQECEAPAPPAEQLSLGDA